MPADFAGIDWVRLFNILGNIDLSVVICVIPFIGLFLIALTFKPLRRLKKIITETDKSIVEE